MGLELESGVIFIDALEYIMLKRRHSLISYRSYDSL
ncbi:MAG: hypothetical protein ACI945_000015 [Pseudohongiellaceae bacterium]|jgi:hypothetical protein